MRLKFIFLLFVTFMGLNAQAQKQILADLKLPESLCDTALDIPTISAKKIIIECDPITQSKHIGISLFSPETKQMIGRPICEFLERLALQLCMSQSVIETTTYLEREKINLTFNGKPYGSSQFRSIKKVIDAALIPSDFQLTNVKKRFHAVFYFNLFDRLEIEFPASRELIFGTDKKAADKEVYATLLSETEVVGFPPHNLPSIESLQQDSTGLYVSKGKSFMIDILNENKYYTLNNNNKLEVLFSQKFPEESIRNLMWGITGVDPTFYVTHRMYGGYTPSFDLRLSKLFQTFGDDFTPYIGTQILDEQTLQCVIVFHNHTFNYLHMIVCSIPIREIDSIATKTIKADFFSNIPQHNLKKLF